jgi:hypothetical protein
MTEQSTREHLREALWRVLEPRLEDVINLDLNDPTENATMVALIRQIEDAILAADVVRHIQAEAMDPLRKIIRRQERALEGYESSLWTDSAQAELGDLRAAIARVRALHEPDADGVCPSCATAIGGGWDIVPVESPCQTLRALPIEKGSTDDH